MTCFLLILLVSITFQANAQLMPEKMANFYDEITMSEQKFKKLDQAIKKEPNEPWYYWMKAEFQIIMGQDAEAIQNYEKSISVDPKFDAGHASLARHLYLSDSTQLKKALMHINKAIQLDSNEGYYFIDRGNIYLAMKEYEHAMQDANLASKNHADEIGVAHLKIEILHQSGQKEALYQFVKQNDLSEEGTSFGPDFLLMLASVYEEMGEKDTVCKLYHYASESFMLFDDEIPSHLAEKLKKCK